MRASTSETQGAGSELRVGMADVVQFVRQLSHDLRNQLNAAELQSAYLKEIATDDEIKEEVQRLRAMLSELGTSLQRLTASLAPSKLNEIPYEAAALLEDLEQKVAATFPEAKGQTQWTFDVGNSALSVDPQILQQAFLELIANAFQHGRGNGSIRIEATADGEFVLSLIEPKTAFAESTDDWGREPFRKVKHGHYGLGLYRARNIIEAHGGRLEVRHDPSSSLLITTIALPLADNG